MEKARKLKIEILDEKVFKEKLEKKSSFSGNLILMATALITGDNGKDRPGDSALSLAESGYNIALHYNQSSPDETYCGDQKRRALSASLLSATFAEP